MTKETTKRRVKGGLLSMLSGLLYILSVPQVRNFIWDRLVGKGQKKVIDAQARIVEEEQKKKRKWFS